MARREDVLGVTGEDTVIGAGVVVHGDLTSDGDMIIDGELLGNIKIQGNLKIGVNAIINGHVSGANVTVGGALQGNIITEGEAAIIESGNVVGDVVCSTLSVRSGAIFQGRVKMQTTQTLALEDTNSEDERG